MPHCTEEWRNMTFDKFTLKIILRVLLLLVSIITFSYFWTGYSGLLFTYCLLALIILAQIWEFVHFSNHSNRQLKKFLEAVSHDDFAVTFNNKNLGKSFSELRDSFSILIEKLKNTRATQHSHSELMNLVLESVKIGLIVVDKNGMITIMNSSAQQMLDIPQFFNWEMFQKKKPNFAGQLGDFNFEGRKLISVDTKDFYLDLEHITLMGDVYHIISFSDLKNEIEQKEIEAWHKLIVILAHEVMNSITPISSLSETIQQMLTAENGEALKQKDLDQEKIEDVIVALKTIVRRSRGMLSFVNEYRKLTKLPAPNFELFNIKEFLVDVVQLMTPQLEQSKVEIEIVPLQSRLGLKADRKMVEQVLINLIGNAINALENIENPKIIISAELSENYTIIDLKDNGKGISEDIISSIFIPFFSTRKNGSGIGLTLSKNIMKLHHGNISVISKVGEGTRFRLTFK